ncbi:MAG: GNAT family N-acetyltransferase [Paracoccaceae bacterium]
MSVALTGIPTLETDRLILRAPRTEDAEAYIQFYMSDRSQFVGGPKTRRDAWDFFGTVMGHWIMRGFGLFILTLRNDDAPLGLVGHWFPDARPEKEVGWMLFDASQEGKGIAFEAAQTCVDHAWNALKWDQMVSYIAHGNDRSCALAERLGAVEDPNAVDLEHPCHVYRHTRPS